MATYQTAQAQLAEQATAVILAAQDVAAPPDAQLNSSAFITSFSTFAAMLDRVQQQWQFDRLMTSMIQDAGRTAQSVAVAVRPGVGFARLLSVPACSRCTDLAGRTYHYSHGFLRHPADNCVMLPTPDGEDRYAQDATDLASQGRVSGLSTADRQAIASGAVLAQLVDVRLPAAGMTDSGRLLSRRGRHTPESIYRLHSERSDALAALQSAGYLR